MKSLRRVPGVPFALALLAAAAIACGVFAPSVREEKAAAPEFQKAVLEQFPAVENAEVRAYVDGMGRALLASVNTQGLDYSFTPLWSEDVNAFAGVGGKTFVFSGLVLQAEAEEEVAGVVAHEIGHVVARHIADAIDRQTTLQLGLAALVLATGEAAYGDVGQLVGGLALLKFSRDAETQADEIGVRLLVNSGYDPEGLARFFEKLVKLEREKGAPPTFLSSHPASAERMKHVRALGAQMAAGKTFAKKDPARHRRVQELLRTLPQPPPKKKAQPQAQGARRAR